VQRSAAGRPATSDDLQAAWATVRERLSRALSS
jgi:hypothetical protein